MLFVRTPREFYLARLALGAAEAGFFPGVIFYLSQWFPSAKRCEAISRFYIALPLSSVIMGALAGMLLSLQGHLRLAGWQWLFLMEGLPAILVSLLFLYCLPDSPQQATWLTSDERTWILRQLQSELSADGVTPTRSSLGIAFREPRIWLLGIFLFCTYLSLYGYVFTAPTIIQQATGFSPTLVGLIISLFGILGAVAMLLSGWHSDRTRERYLHILVPVLFMATAFLVAGLTRRPAIALLAFGLISTTSCAYQVPVWALPSSFLHGKSAAVGIATMNTIAIFGGFVGPWWLGVARDLTGNYQRGLLTLVIPLIAASAIILIIRRYSRPPQAQPRMATSLP
jgi:ACS family tartrate transporter-like MFS transporter